MPLLIHDVHNDAMFRTHPAARAFPIIGSYIGVPIVLGDGELFGTLCAVDPEPHILTPQQADLLVVLGRIIATQIERDREMTLRVQAEAEQARLYSIAQEAIRERENFLSIAAHELKNPLAALLGYAHLLERRITRETSFGERDERALHSIVTQAERLNSMLADLMDVSRLGSGQFSIEQLPLDLSTLTHRIVDELQSVLVKHAVTIDDKDSPMIVNGDEERLAQVLRNLLGNAVKYSPAGGHVAITIEANGDQACVSIQDQGIGIPASALSDLFQRFYRAPNGAAHAIHGFGIGLYVVKEIVMRHNGTITVASTENVGTTFTVCLPLLKQAG